MHLAFSKKLVFATVASALVVAAVSLNSIGQDAKKADSKAKAGAKEKPKGRLPALLRMSRRTRSMPFKQSTRNSLMNCRASLMR